MTSTTATADAKFATARNVEPVTLAVARRVLLNSLRVQVQNPGKRSTVINFEGEAGIGKTQSIYQVVEELSDELGDSVTMVNWKLMTQEKEDVGGYPTLHQVTIDDQPAECFSYVPEKRIAELAASGKPAVIFFDEWPRADRAVCSVMFSAIEDGKLGSFKLPANWFIVAASNPTEGYQGNGVDADHAYRRRFCWLAISFNYSEFIAHIKKANYHDAVVAYCTSNPRECLDTAARAKGFVYANPAAWQKVSEYMKAQEAAGSKVFSSAVEVTAFKYFVGGLMGRQVAATFVKFCRQYMEEINPQEIVSNYKNTRDKVLRLASQGRTDILNPLAMAVWKIILASQPSLSNKTTVKDVEIGKVPYNICRFINDIPLDIAMAALSSTPPDVDVEVTKYILAFTKEAGKSGLWKTFWDKVKVSQDVAKDAK